MAISTARHGRRPSGVCCATVALRDSRIGIGQLASWPTAFGALGIPIDHVLVGGAIAVNGRVLGEVIASDHRPIVVGLRVKD